MRFRINRKFIIQVSAVILILALFNIILGLNVIVFVFMISFIVLNALIARMQITKSIPTDLQLSTFSIALITACTTLQIGLIYAVVPRLVASGYAKSLTLDNIFSITTHILTAIFVYFFSFVNIVFLGVIVSIFDLTVMWIKRKFIQGYSFDRNFLFGSTRFTLNLLLFLIFGEFFKTILTI